MGRFITSPGGRRVYVADAKDVPLEEQISPGFQTGEVGPSGRGRIRVSRAEILERYRRNPTPQERKRAIANLTALGRQEGVSNVQARRQANEDVDQVDRGIQTVESGATLPTAKPGPVPPVPPEDIAIPTNPDLSRDGTGLTMTEIIARYQNGDYGVVGTPEARDEAIAAIANIWLQSGVSRDESIDRATATFDREVQSDEKPVPTWVGTEAKPQGPLEPLPPEDIIKVGPFTGQREEEEELSRNEAGRREVFRRFLANSLPLESPAPFRRFLERQEEPFSDIFALQRGLGQISEKETFRDFLRGQGQLGAPEPSRFGGLLDLTRQLLGQTPGLDENPTRAAFREALEGNLPRQQELALRGAQSGVPFELRQSLKDIGARNFNAYRVRQGLGELGTQSLLDYMRPGDGGFIGRTSPDQFRGLVDQVGNLVGGPGAGLSDIQTTFRKELLEDPESQFNLALQAALPNIPANMRNAFSDLAEREFRRFQSKQGLGTPFLPYASQRGFKFFQ